MRPRWIPPPILLLILLFPAFAATNPQESASAPAEKVQVGSLLTDFVLADATGKTLFSPGGEGGRPAVLWFWSLYDDSCGEGMLALRSVQERFGERNLLVLAINVDTQAGTGRITRFLERFEKFRGKITYPVLFDQKRKVLATFGIPHSPAAVIVDEKGRIAAILPGPGSEIRGDLHGSLEKILGGSPEREDLDDLGEGRTRTVTVTGQAPFCGFFESGVWRKGFTGNYDFSVELGAVREAARKDASMKVMVQALDALGISLFSRERNDVCVDGRGIHLGRDPLPDGGPLANLMEMIPFDDYFHTVDEKEKILDNTVYLARTERIFLDQLAADLLSMGYTFFPMSIRILFINLPPADHGEFLQALLEQSLFIRSFENPDSPGESSSLALDIHSTSQGFAKEIEKMDFGALEVFVEEVTPSSIEIEVWK